MSSEVNQPRRDRHTAACQNKQPRFDPEEFHFRRQVFRQYRCPFRDEPNRGCFREDKPDRCFFAHPDTPDLPPFVQLIDVPTYICIYSLINGCHFTTVDKPRGPHTTETIPICSVGFHPTAADLVDLEQFEATHCSLIASHLAADGERQCAICFERIHSKRHIRDRSFGILESCNHCFCAPCIIKWQSRDADRVVRCPMCRAMSARVAIRAQFTEDPEEKRRIFDRIHCSCARA